MVRNRFIAYVVMPLALCGAALLFTRHIPGIDQHSFFTFFLGGVATAAFLSGWQAALITAGMSVLASAIYILPPNNSIVVENSEDAVRLLGFAFTSFLICALAAAAKRYQRALQGAEASLKSKEDEIAFLKNTGSVWSWEYDAATRRVRLSNIFNSRQLIRREQDLEVWLGAIDAADRAMVRAAIERALVEGEFEARYRMSADGRPPRRIISRAVVYAEGSKAAGLRGIEMSVEMEPEAVTPTAAR